MVTASRDYVGLAPHSPLPSLDCVCWVLGARPRSLTFEAILISKTETSHPEQIKSILIESAFPSGLFWLAVASAWLLIAGSGWGTSAWFLVDLFWFAV